MRRDAMFESNIRRTTSGYAVRVLKQTRDMFSLVKQVNACILVLVLSISLDCIALPKALSKEEVNDLIKSNCSADLPNLDLVYNDFKRKQVRWDEKTIKTVEAYQPYVEKGVLQFKPGMTIGGNTPINSQTSALDMSFYFPSLRGIKDPGYFKDKKEFFKSFQVAMENREGIPESNISVVVLEVGDWKSLPLTREIDFFKQNFRPNLTPVEVKQARKEYEEYVRMLKSGNPDRQVKYVGNYEQFGLKEYIAKRHGLFYYEPISNSNPSPYGIPRFACDATGRVGVYDCVGHFKMGSDYLVTYQIPYKLMQCWWQVEEGVKRVIRLNTQEVE